MALPTQEGRSTPPPASAEMMSDSNAVGAVSITNGAGEEAKVWERPWTIDEMRKAANNWSLAGDAGMLQYLQDFSQRMISRTHDIQEQVNGLIHESKLTEVRVSNAFNDFIMLANTQFVENRVYDEDVNALPEKETVKKEEKEKTREEREAELVPKISKAMLLGLGVIDTAFEKLDMNDMDSDSEDEDGSPYKTDPILEPKDPYLSRPLPDLIGSQAFMMDDDVGLTELLSEEEESDHGSLSESESESDEADAQPQRKHTLSDSDSGTDSESENNSDIFGDKASSEEIGSDGEETKPSAPKSFADELAAKMNDAETPQHQDSSKGREKKRADSSTKRSRASSKTKTSVTEEDDNLFGPPPMEDEDSPFGKKGGLFSSGGGLFDDDDDNEGGLFDDVVEERKPQQPTPQSTSHHLVTEDSDHDDQTDNVKKEPEKRGRTRSGKKVPVGGVSIFGSGDDDLFSKTPKAVESDSDEEERGMPATKVNQAKPVPSQPLGGSGGLFDDDDDDLFATAMPKKEPEKKEVKKKPAVDLFDGDEEEEGDLFSTVAPPSSTPAPPIDKPKKKLPAGAVSMFGGVSNPLAAAIRAQRPQSDHEGEDSDKSEPEEKISRVSSKSSIASGTGLSGARLMPEKTDRSPSVSSNSLFAEEPEDDLFAAKPKAPAAGQGSTSQSKPEQTAVGGATRSGGLFGEDGSDDDDLFSASSKPKPAKTSKPRTASLFLEENEDEGDLFGSKPPPTNRSETKKTPPGGAELFDDDLFGEIKTPGKVEPKPKNAVSAAEPQRPRNATLSLFDDDDDNDDGADIFGAPSVPKAAPAEPKPTSDKVSTKPRTRSLFADDDVLFGTEGDDPQVDLFGSSSPLSPSDESKPFPPVPKKPQSRKNAAPKPPVQAAEKEKVVVKGATTSATSTDVVTGGATSSSDLIPDRKVESKVEVKGATVGESSTDKAKDVEPVRKKPVGAVSMFGAMDPASLFKKRAGSGASTSEEIAQPHVAKPLGNSPISSEIFNSSPGRDKVDASQPTPFPKPSRGSSIGKLKANLAINPAALLPGAAPPVKEPDPVALTFEKPAQASTLHTVQKDRVRVPNKRRPPSRKARQVAGQSDIDFTDSTDVSTVTNPVVAPPSRIPRSPPAGSLSDDDIFPSSRPNPLLPGSAASVTKAANNVAEYKQDPVDLLPSFPKEKETNRMFANDDIFGDLPPPITDNGDDDEDLFTSTPDSRGVKKGIIHINDDIFGPPSLPPSSKTRSGSGSRKPMYSDNTDIFGANTATSTTTAKTKTTTTVDRDDNDIFADSSIVKKKSSKPTVPDENDLFATPAQESSKPLSTAKEDIFTTVTSTKQTSGSTNKLLDDNEDLFATATNSAPPSGMRKKQKAAVKDDALFDDNTDIFADIPEPKPREKKIKKKPVSETKSLFKDDTDDIFAEASSKPKIKKTSATRKKTTKPSSTSGDIFNDEAPNIFDDPLNAMQQ